jgi:hypothetical protein
VQDVHARGRVMSQIARPISFLGSPHFCIGSFGSRPGATAVSAGQRGGTASPENERSIGDAMFVRDLHGLGIHYGAFWTAWSGGADYTLAKCIIPV